MSGGVASPIGGRPLSGGGAHARADQTPAAGWGDKGTVLLIEDEASIADLVRLYLERDGYHVEWRGDGIAGLAAAEALHPRLVVLDLMLPGIDGFEVMRSLQERAPVPIIVVTARDEEADRVLGLELGADDYVTKPFSPRELVARVKAVLRRAQPTRDEDAVSTVLHLGALTLDIARREVTVAGVPVRLTAREFDLLAYLVRNRGIVLTRDQILERVWGYSFAADTRTVDVHVRQLRAKLGDESLIETIRGVGYRAEDRE